MTRRAGGRTAAIVVTSLWCVALSACSAEQTDRAPAGDHDVGAATDSAGVPPLEPLDGDVLIRGGALIDLSPATTQDEARAAAALTEAARTAGSRQGDGVHDAQTTVVLTRYPAEALATVALLDRDPIDVAFDLLLAIGETSRAVAMPR